MLFFARTLYRHWIAEGNADRSIRSNLSQVLEPATYSPCIGFQGNRYHRYLAAFGQLDTQRIKFFGDQNERCASSAEK